MSNEFVARNGIIALDNSIISGSLDVTNGITGSLFGTASWANNVITASRALQANTASYVLQAVSSSFTTNALSASIAANAVTASRALNANTASHAILAVTASRALNANTASYVLSASYAPGGGASLTGGSGSFVAVWATATTLTTGSIFDTPSGVGVNTRFPAAELQVSGTTDVVNIRGSGSLATSSIFTVDGAAGRLFSVNDSLSGSLFSVNTIAGLPVIEAFSDNTVRIGQYGRKAIFVSQSRVGFGKEDLLNADVDISGSMDITGSLDVRGNVITTGSLDVSGAFDALQFYGNSRTPTLTAGAAAGTSPTVSISGSDTSGYIRVLTGTATVANSTIVRVAFANTYSGLPYVLTTPANFSASFVAGGVSGTFTTASTSGFSIFSGQAPLRGTQAYTWSYHVIG